MKKLLFKNFPVSRCFLPVGVHTVGTMLLLPTFTTAILVTACVTFCPRE